MLDDPLADARNAWLSATRYLIWAGGIMLFFLLAVYGVMPGRISWLGVAVVSVMWTLPAAGLMACGIALQFRCRWAITVGRVLAGFYGVAFVAAAVVACASAVPHKDIAAAFSSMLFGVAAVVFVQLVRQLAKARPYLESGPRGFEVVLSNPPTPPAPPPPPLAHEATENRFVVDGTEDTEDTEY